MIASGLLLWVGSGFTQEAGDGSAPAVVPAAEPVATEATPTSPAKQTLTVEVRVTGISDDALNNVLAYLTIEQKKQAPKLAARWVKRMHLRAPQEIEEALQPFGYFSTTVESSLSDRPGGWLAEYRVTPGVQTRVSAVNVEVSGAGADEPAIREALAAFPVKSGEPLDSDAYDSGKDDLLDLIDRLGYARATVPLHQLRVNPDRAEATVELHIDTGEKYHFGAVTLDQDVVDSTFLERYIQVEPGDVYSQQKLLQLQGDLVQTQYFSVVDVKPDLDQADDRRVPVNVSMEPADRHKLDFGLGFYTDIGPTVSAHWRFRPLNRRGHVLNALLKLSPVKSSATLSYWIPVGDPRNDKLAFSLGAEHEDSTSQKRDTFDLKGGYYFLWHEWDSSLFADLRHETFTTGSQPETTSLILSLGGNLERTWVDDKRRFPTSGHYWFFELLGSPGLISDTGFTRGHIKTRHFIPVGDNGRVNLRAELGLAWVELFEKYPSSFRYYAGGDNSVRGYKYQALGPLDEEDDVVGGKHVATATIEYDHRVAKDWVAAAFVDGGNAFNDSLETIFYGAGVGVRWLSPVGSVRLDFAVPINGGDVTDDKWRIHVGFGAEL